MRTLVYGYKKINRDELDDLKNEVNEARKTLGPNRKKFVERVYAKFEDGLTLLGVSALEDRLQERVPETMERLKAAGIKVFIRYHY